ncbi:MAG: ATP-binding protein [Candidatus Dormibacteria bacterium]
MAIASPPTEAPVPWHRSLRWRLTLVFVGLLAVLLAVAGVVEYGVLRQAVLGSRAQSLQSSFRAARDIVLAQERNRLHSGRPALDERAAARELARLLAQSRLTVAVFTPGLQLVASAAPSSTLRGGVTSGVPVPPESASLLAQAAQDGEQVGPNQVSFQGKSSLVMIFPVRTRLGRQLGAVQLAEPAGPIDGELQAAALILGLGGLGVVLLALLSGLWLTSRGLAPLHRLTQTARALGAGDLSQRSGLSPRQDEVGVLARVFDEMAGSVERTVRVREEAEQRMRQFIADASHELRTPLTAIKGYLDVLRRGAKSDPSELDHSLTVMAQEADRMRALVLDLLTLARADAQPSLQPQEVELGPFLREQLGGRPDTELQLAPGVVAWADPETLATVVGNLQGNAERHGQGAAVRWTTLEEGDLVGFACSDRGPGIAPEDLPHIFGRFYRAGGSRSRQDGGSGLGLAIVQALVEAQGGRVVAESVLGEGATFTVLLNRRRASGWRREEEAGPTAEAGQSGTGTS